MYISTEGSDIFNFCSKHRTVSKGIKMKKLSFMVFAIILMGWNTANAQIYAQGQNINNLHVFSINLEMVEKPLDPSKFLAKVDFYGRDRNVDWYLKEGVEHKSFNDDKEAISYMEDNGWIFLKKELVKSKSGHLVRERYLFRKSMEMLKQDNEEQVSTKNKKTKEK